jgi:hypothetical protein
VTTETRNELIEDENWIKKGTTDASVIHEMGRRTDAVEDDGQNGTEDYS